VRLPFFQRRRAGRLADIPPGEVEIARLPAPPEGQAIAAVEIVVRLRSA
jgi:hypothetical protein